MNYDVVALGELLIDFTGSGLSEQGNPTFEANPGGAPCNVLAMLAKLDKKTAFIGKVGEDMFGQQLRNTIEQAGIDSAGLVVDPAVNTTLAFVQIAPDGDRDFSFFRKPGADTMLRAQEMNAALLENCKIFHFGTLSLTHQPAKSATREAVATAKRAGALISFDPNLRPPLWVDLADAKREMEWGCAQCDILKIADEELLFLTDCDDLAQGAQTLRRTYPNIRLLFVTKGKHGAEAFLHELHAAYPSYLEVKTIDTTGAGDTFCGSCLAYLLEHALETLTEANLLEMLRYANAAASLVTTKKGAIRSMPAHQEVLALMDAHED